MTIDRYTKVVLTVIALCLVWLSVGGPSLITPVSAQDAQRVVLTGWTGQDGRIRYMNSGANAGADSLPVWIANR